MLRYHDCQFSDQNHSPCSECSLSNYGRDCRNNPANTLAYLRAAVGLTQAQLSAASGVHKMQISRIERGDIKVGNISLATAIALAKALGVKAEDLLN